MARRANCISFFEGNYKERKTPYGPEEFNEYAMMSDLADFIRIALKNGRVLKVWRDEYTIVVEYDYHSPELAENTLEWVGEDEYVESYGKSEEFNAEPEEYIVYTRSSSEKCAFGAENTYEKCEKDGVSVDKTQKCVPEETDL